MNKGVVDLRRDATAVFVVASILIVVRSEFKDNQMKKEMKRNKKEADAKADKNKAEADAKMDRNFIITNSISATSLLISLVMALAAMK